MSKFQGVKERIWVSEFSNIALEKFYAEFIEMEADPTIQVIPIIVSSYGGNLDNMNAMRDLIKSSNKPVSIAAIGKSMSAGAALLAAGTKGHRMVAPNTDVMIHELSAGAFGKMEEIMTTALNLDRKNKEYMENMSEDMGKARGWLMAQLKKQNNLDWHLTAEECVKMGIADYVGVPRTYLSPPQQTLEVNMVPKKGAGKNKKG